MIKEVYFTETKWKPIHDNLGGVSGKIVFKEPVSYQDYLSISRKEYLLLDENQDKEIERLNRKIKSIVYQCYGSDMSYGEFKQIWVNAMGKTYEPSQIDELEKELGVDKEC